MANITITTQTAGKCVEVDFGDLYGNPAFPFINAPRSYYFKGHVARVAPFSGYLRVIMANGESFDLTAAMVDTVDGTAISTQAELETAVVAIINANLV